MGKLCVLQKAGGPCQHACRFTALVSGIAPQHIVPKNPLQDPKICHGDSGGKLQPGSKCHLPARLLHSEPLDRKQVKDIRPDHWPVLLSSSLLFFLGWSSPKPSIPLLSTRIRHEALQAPFLRLLIAKTHPGLYCR